MSTPLEQFFTDRQRAQAAEDPMAAVCTAANVDAQGLAQLRTLVLREVAGSWRYLLTPPLQNGRICRNS